MDIFAIIQLLIPIITFAMGYFLSNIGYKRDRKLSVIREKFEKLYHPFYLLICELGTDVEEGYVLDIEDGSVLRRLLDHLITNAYLATPEGQRLIEATRKLFVRCMAEGGKNDEENEKLFEEPLTKLSEHLMREYVKAVNALGYEFEAEVAAEATKTR